MLHPSRLMVKYFSIFDILSAAPGSILHLLHVLTWLFSPIVSPLCTESAIQIGQDEYSDSRFFLYFHQMPDCRSYQNTSPPSRKANWNISSAFLAVSMRLYYNNLAVALFSSGPLFLMHAEGDSTDYRRCRRWIMKTTHLFKLTKHESRISSAKGLLKSEKPAK